jgi:enoyl-[acyl-carrier-protein] reductase (NADH)
MQNIRESLDTTAQVSAIGNQQKLSLTEQTKVMSQQNSILGRSVRESEARKDGPLHRRVKINENTNNKIEQYAQASSLVYSVNNQLTSKDFSNTTRDSFHSQMRISNSSYGGALSRKENLTPTASRSPGGQSQRPNT